MKWALCLSFYSLQRTMKWLHYLEIIKLLRHLGLAYLIVWCMNLSAPFILRLVFAFKDGQGPGEKPILCPQPASSLKDSILEQIHSSGMECWVSAPSSGFRRHLTNTLQAQESPRQLGSGEGRELHVCPQPWEPGKAHPGIQFACSFLAGRTT